jgi:rubrerythrin
MNVKISRRQFLHISALLTFCYPFAHDLCFAIESDIEINKGQFPLTIKILKEAYNAELIANRHYGGYCQKALSENYTNIAYLFSALEISEKIHAENYKKLITSLGSMLKDPEFSLSISDTKTNLNNASKKELIKIKDTYPYFFEKLSAESNDQAIVYCMYSWKSHQQHEEIISDIKKYSGIFFRPLANKIERMRPNYYVCEICGATVDEKPETPCDICNYPLIHYKHLERPTIKS